MHASVEVQSERREQDDNSQNRGRAGSPASQLAGRLPVGSDTYRNMPKPTAFDDPSSAAWNVRRSPRWYGGIRWDQ